MILTRAAPLSRDGSGVASWTKVGVWHGSSIGADEFVDYPVAANRSNDCSGSDSRDAERPKIGSEKMGLRAKILNLQGMKNIREPELHQEQ
jgi:hypothetical protein